MQDFYLRNQTFTGERVEIQLTFAGMLFRVSATIFMFVGTTLYPFVGLRILLLSGIILTTVGLITAGFASSVRRYIQYLFYYYTGLFFDHIYNITILLYFFIRYGTCICQLVYVVA